MDSMTLPNLSLVRNWSPEPLNAASQHWALGAEAWRGVIGTVHAEAQGLDWQGMAHNSSMEDIAQIHQIVMNNADKLEQAAEIAFNASSNLLTMANYVKYRADDLIKDQYAIDDTTIVVTDNKRDGSLQNICTVAAWQ